MSEPLTGAESARPETFAEKSRREALAAALSAIQALRDGKAHPHVYRGAAGHQQKLQERREAAQKLLAGRKTRAPVAQHNAHVRLWQQTLNLPPDYTSAYNFVPGGGRDNWRGD